MLHFSASLDLYDVFAILCSTKTIATIESDVKAKDKRKEQTQFVTSHSSATNVKMKRISRKHFGFKAIRFSANIASLT